MNSDFDSYVQGFCTAVVICALVGVGVAGAPAYAFVGLGGMLLILIAGEFA